MKIGIAIVACLAVAATAGAAVRSPTLRIANVKPLVVRGSGFHARERVRVVVTSASNRWTRRVTATASGTVAASFGSLPVNRCSLVAKAFGSGGSRASTKPAEPACPEPIGP
jgi:hypothetical protein